MNEPEVVLYFLVAFGTRKFTVYRKTDISHVMLVENVPFILNIDNLTIGFSTHLGGQGF